MVYAVLVVLCAETKLLIFVFAWSCHQQATNQQRKALVRMRKALVRMRKALVRMRKALVRMRKALVRMWTGLFVHWESRIKHLVWSGLVWWALWHFPAPPPPVV